jgi:hypothetical protein
MSQKHFNCPYSLGHYTRKALEMVSEPRSERNEHLHCQCPSSRADLSSSPSFLFLISCPHHCSHVRQQDSSFKLRPLDLHSQQLLSTQRRHHIATIHTLFLLIFGLSRWMVRAVHLCVVHDFCTHHNLPSPYATDADSEWDVPEFMSTSDCPRLLSKNAETEKELLVQLTNCAVDHIVLHLRCLSHHGVHLPHHCNNVF